MPPKAARKLKDSIEQEGRILLAISAIKKQEIRTIAEAARIYNIPRTTLRRRLNGHTFRAETRANGHKLTQNEENSLVHWILSLDQRGAPPRPAHVREMANILLLKRGFSDTPTTVGENWVYTFIKRREELKTQFSRRYNYQRAKCEDPKLLREWFERVQITIMQYGIQPDDIYNFDETGFAMGLISTAKVVTRAELAGRPFLLQPGNREWVTSIECISSRGPLPPCLIFKGKVHIEGWYEMGLPSDWRIETSANGWTTDEIGLRWLQQLFIPFTAGRTVGRYRLLILDGHGSHLTPQFDDICSQNDIIPLCMPAHSSHLLQPLDVGCFGPLKRAYGQLVENKMRLGFNHIDKLDFLEAFPQARAQIYTTSNICSGFSATGLIPFNPERVLSQLNIQLEATPPGSRPSSRSTNSVPKTPHNLKQLQKQETTLKKLLRARTKSPDSPTKIVIKQLFKGYERALNEATIVK
ncbi:unnamed protein product [Aspergillus oryzae var. brunneus]|uniref:Unnamed protein product n=1 Tax=Aspergillus oryzae var. brunneus TaxID=332754 RepID=A0ABQ6KH87_ASPOZ|nr:unnamed protein product [Aspergillus oryzae var. brunneus]